MVAEKTERLRLAEESIERMRLENERQRLEMERLQEERLCGVCMEAPRDSCLHPCGHTFCACCIARLQQAAQRERCPPLCPACRVAFVSASRIFSC